MMETEDSESNSEQKKSLGFNELGLSENLLKAIEDEKFEKPSEIQEKSIPFVIQGKDVIAKASTGSGKTLAFASVILKETKKDFGIQSLILTPTRELAQQIASAMNKFSKHKPLKITAVYGGVSINPQIEDLEEAEIVIGTPGRILDHLERGTINLTLLKTLVLDEADRMFDMGFIDDVKEIISHCPKKRQTLLFSATISEDIARLAKKYMNNPIEISAEQYVDPTKLTQVYYDVEDGLKYSLLKHLLENEKAKLVMVFCNTRRNVDFVANNLKAAGINALPIHGGFSQDKRNKVMEQFHTKKVHVLVCTDVAARGLDIQEVTHIYNYDIPPDSTEYLHRIGRTARAGKEGKVINIITSRDYENFRSVLMDDELEITKVETPYVKRSEITWMLKPRFGRRFGGSSRGFSRGSGGRESRGYNRGGGSSGRSGGSSRGYSRDRNERSSKQGFRGGRSRPSWGDRRDRNDRGNQENRGDRGNRSHRGYRRDRRSEGRSYSKRRY